MSTLLNRPIGLPTKGRIEKPIFDYEKVLYDSLLTNEYSNILNHNFKHKHLWVKKSTGLGVTEFFLYICNGDIDVFLFHHNTYIPLPNSSRNTIFDNGFLTLGVKAFSQSVGPIVQL